MIRYTLRIVVHQEFAYLSGIASNSSSKIVKSKTVVPPTIRVKIDGA